MKHNGDVKVNLAPRQQPEEINRNGEENEPGWSKNVIDKLMKKTIFPELKNIMLQILFWYINTTHKYLFLNQKKDHYKNTHVVGRIFVNVM